MSTTADAEQHASERLELSNLITNAQIQSYVSDGFLAVKNVVTPALVSHCMNARSLLPWGTGGNDKRNVVPAAGIDPCAWKGYETPPKDVFVRPLKKEKQPA